MSVSLCSLVAVPVSRGGGGGVRWAGSAVAGSGRAGSAAACRPDLSRWQTNTSEGRSGSRGAGGCAAAAPSFSRSVPVHVPVHSESIRTYSGSDGDSLRARRSLGGVVASASTSGRGVQRRGGHGHTTADSASGGVVEPTVGREARQGVVVMVGTSRVLLERRRARDVAAGAGAGVGAGADAGQPGTRKPGGSIEHGGVNGLCRRQRLRRAAAVSDNGVSGSGGARPSPRGLWRKPWNWMWWRWWNWKWWKWWVKSNHLRLMDDLSSKFPTEMADLAHIDIARHVIDAFQPKKRVLTMRVDDVSSVICQALGDGPAAREGGRRGAAEQDGLWVPRQGRAVQVENRICKHGIRRRSPLVSNSTPV